jgi:hypothetical protein
MGWQYKAVDASRVLAPLLFTINAYLSDEKGLMSFQLWAAVIVWLSWALDLSIYVRGYLANARGVQPTQRGKEPDLDRERRDLIFWMVVCGFVLITLLADRLHHGTKDPTLVFAFFAFLVLMLSNYARNSFWDVEFN